jgi:hypothetical protein
MNAVVVRYTTRPDTADENQRLIEAVFAELAATQPVGFTYNVFRLEDGVSFVHTLLEHEGVEHPDTLGGVAAFQTFVAGVDERCAIAPVAMRSTVVGTYR